MATVTASARSVSYSQPGIMVPENWEAFLSAGLDEVFMRMLDSPRQGRTLFFREMAMKKRDHKFYSYYGLNAVKMARDAANLPSDEMGIGFDWTLTSNTFRGQIQIERELLEDELYGAVARRQTQLSEAMVESEELIMADFINRALGTAGAPVLCEDGMYFLDSARPNPNKRAGTWSNLEATSALTPTAVFTAQLNFAKYRNEIGQLKPLVMTDIYYRPDEDKTVFEIMKSDLRPTDASNAANWAMGKFQYHVVNRMTAQQIIYSAGGVGATGNELYFGMRSAPELMTWTGDNVDVIKQRIRARFGIGCGRPYTWRGGALS